jgi:hypothetical protein
MSIFLQLDLAWDAPDMLCLFPLFDFNPSLLPKGATTGFLFPPILTTLIQLF